ncbi:MAG: toll/interleukin-1 receptor domain-containing protein [Aestuariivirga sp.]|nr:toll/interleukin-1 receptor domain-containing protein [Aestuariivirga sp.]
MTHDVFICHASEDKEDFVRPLAELLRQQHIDVWYDEFSLSVGDSLTQKIDEGLVKSKFGIVVLSPSFFKKPWAKRELKGLTAREMFEKQDIILPIWHRVGIEEVIQYSPPLADKKAISSADGINAVMRKLTDKIKPEESPLVVARDYLITLDFDPPPISDEWWLDVTEYKEFLKFPDTNSGKWWIFPLRFPYEDRGRERGLNIALTALQIDWSFEGEELKISPLTPPEKVHSFLRRWPGLLDCARDHPGTLALYVPQLTIPEFDHGLEDVFDELMKRGNKEAYRVFSYGNPDTIDDKEPLCGDVIALRHPKFGNYTPAELASWYFAAHDMHYIRHGCDAFSGLVWLISSSANWLPEKYRNVLVSGIIQRDSWMRDLSKDQWKNPFIQALFKKTRKQHKFTKTIKNGLCEIIDASKKELGIREGSEKFINRLMELDIVNGYYDYQDWIKSLQKRK